MNELAIKWEDLFKVKIGNSDISFAKHEVTKLLLVMLLLNKHKQERNYIRIYTEFRVVENRKCDVYFENIKTKELYVYEIQKSITSKWEEQLKEDYKNWTSFFFKTNDVIVIPIQTLSNNIYDLMEELEQYIV